MRALHLHPVGEGELGVFAVEIDLEDAAGKSCLVTRPLAAEYFVVGAAYFFPLSHHLGVPHLASVDLARVRGGADPFALVIPGGKKGKGEKLGKEVVRLFDEDPLPEEVVETLGEGIFFQVDRIGCPGGGARGFLLDPILPGDFFEID